MGSLAPEEYASQHEGQQFVVKLEPNPYDDALLRTSSEEDFADFTDPNTSDSASTLLRPPDSSLFRVKPSAPPTQMGTTVAGQTTSNGADQNHDSKDSIPISKRTLQNRKAQREFRQRRATYLKDLEAKVKKFEGDPAMAHPEMHGKVQHLIQENQYLRAIIDRLQAENAEFRNLEAHYAGQNNLSLPAGSSQYVHGSPSYTSHSRTGSAYSNQSLPSIDMYAPMPYYSYEPTRTQSDPQPAPTSLPSYHNSSSRSSHAPPSSSSPVHRTVYAAPTAKHMEWASVKQSSNDNHHHPHPRPLSSRSEGDRLDNVQDSRSNDNRKATTDYLHPTGHTPTFYRTTHDISGLLPQQVDPVSSGSSSHTSTTSSLYGQYPSSASNSLIDTRTTTPQGMSAPESSLIWGTGATATTYSPTSFNLPPASLPFAGDQVEYGQHPPELGTHMNVQPHTDTRSPTAPCA